MPPIVLLTGLTGRTTSYQTFQFDTRWNRTAGCYAFVAGVAENRHVRTSAATVLYIGETESFQRRMSEHENDFWLAALDFGATHVLARVIPDVADRQAEEQDLIRRYRPRMNTRHVN